jgi:alcohol dehydrogenase (NADP+)
LKTLIDSARLKPEMNQIELHPYLQQPAMLDFCNNNGVHLTAYSPLGSPDRPVGLKAKDEPNLLEDQTIADIANTYGVTPGQVLINWAVQRGTSVIPKSINPARMKQNLDAAEISLTEADMNRIAALDRKRRYIGGEFWALPGSSYSVANLWDE